MEERKLRIGILTLPIAKASVIPLSNLVEILFNISTEFVLVTGNEGYKKFKNESRFKVYDVSYKIGNTVLKVIRNLYGQIKASLIIIKVGKKINYWIIFGGEREIIVMFIAKLLKKKVIILILGSTIKDSTFVHDPFRNIVKILSAIKSALADKIVVYTPRLISEWKLEPYCHKIIIAHQHFLDFDTFAVTTPLSARPPLIGYIGRLSEEKGIQNFVRSLPTILDDRTDLCVLIGGDGPLKDSIEVFLQAQKLTAHVNLPGWVSYDNLPWHLNQLRLLVLPSYTEGLPNIMLEAMACETPVLATPVGAIPDIIQDGKTGFIMENNSPGCIAANVIRALNSSDLERIAENGRQFVEENFTFEKTVERWRHVLEKIAE
ncbi:MAG: glycosyltransferase family 4 protein [Methanomicrobiales archaeon]|jgi:glycosyltransferase involved in cell wall biosynthesis